MGKKKYIKNSKGVTMSVTTDTLGLEKPLLNENYDIDVHNRNMDKIDEDLKPIDDSYIIELFQHDGDTTNPRDYYTKVEADEKFATKEEVENIDLSNLATKEEANNALNKANEAFQRGDNVKTQLVDKLISEGLNVSTNNTFEELIGNIVLGKKWATGQVVSSKDEKYFSYIGGSGGLAGYYIDITELSFKPSFIFYIAKSTSGGFGIFSNLDQYYTKFFPYVYMARAHDYAGKSTTVVGYQADSRVILSDTSYRFPSNASNVTFNWIAIE